MAHGLRRSERHSAQCFVYSSAFIAFACLVLSVVCFRLRRHALPTHRIRACIVARRNQESAHRRTVPPPSSSSVRLEFMCHLRAYSAHWAINGSQSVTCCSRVSISCSGGARRQLCFSKFTYFTQIAHFVLRIFLLVSVNFRWTAFRMFTIYIRFESETKLSAKLKIENWITEISHGIDFNQMRIFSIWYSENEWNEAPKSHNSIWI